MAYKDKAKMVEYCNGYNRENYDRVTTMLPKGDKDRLKAAADAMGVSVNSYIRAAINEKMERGMTNG